MNVLSTRRFSSVPRCLRASSGACLALWPMLSVLVFAQAPAASPLPDVPAMIDRGLPGESWLTRSSLFRYTQTRFAPISFADSPRTSLEPVNGVIHLSVQEAIALALENNLDIEAVRLLRPAAVTDIQRTKSGLLPRSLPFSVLSGPSSASGPLAASTVGGVPAMGTSTVGLTNQLIGSAIPNTEPVLFATGRTFRNTDPVANPVLTGTNFLDTKETDVTVGVRKNWFTGTELTGQYESSRIAQNSPNNSLNPFLTGNLSLRLDQHLLQGFGRDTNMRAIRVAVNNRRMAELNIRQQITITITQVLGLYYDLAAFTDEVSLLESTSTRTAEALEQDKRRLDMRLVSSADVLQRQVSLEREQQALSDARAQIREQELTLKNVITRSGLENAALVNARIEPTDRFEPSAEEPPEQAAQVADLQVMLGIGDASWI
jgi:outer membrane protein